MTSDALCLHDAGAPIDACLLLFLYKINTPRSPDSRRERSVPEMQRHCVEGNNWRRVTIKYHYRRRFYTVGGALWLDIRKYRGNMIGI